MKKTTKILVSLLLISILILAGTIYYLFFYRHHLVSGLQKGELVRDYTREFSQDLKTAFQQAISEMNLPKESVVMSDYFFGNEAKVVNKKFEDNPENKKLFYMASSIKPAYIAAFIKILNIKNLNYKVPFNFINNEKTKGAIAGEVYNYVTYGYDMDQLLVDTMAPFFKGRNLTSKQIFDEMMTKDGISNYEFSLKDLIKYTLGPSSNWGVVLFRNNLAIKLGTTEEAAVNSIEFYLNDFLKQNNVTSNVRIFMSSQADKDKTYNSSYFYESEYLFKWLYENKFNLPKDILDDMKSAMQNVADDAPRVNRRHEMKSMAKAIFGDRKALIREKSGYIGFDLGAAAGLDAANGWNTMPKKAGKKIVFFDASSFSRTYFKTGNFAQFNYTIAAPVYISLTPTYEELNGDYTSVKNRYLDILEKNIRPVFEKYKDQILTN
jgi:hypothetical protein